MNVRELIEALENIEPDRIVVMQADAEGNGYSPLAGVYAAGYVAESTWSGYVPDDDHGAPALILHPVN